MSGVEWGRAKEALGERKERLRTFHQHLQALSLMHCLEAGEEGVKGFEHGNRGISWKGS
jgi:hypothetical protein